MASTIRASRVRKLTFERTALVDDTESRNETVGENCWRRRSTAGVPLQGERQDPHIFADAFNRFVETAAVVAGDSTVLARHE